MQQYTHVIEKEVSNLRNNHTQAEERSESKRSWAEKRLSQEETTIVDLQNQVKAVESALERQKAEHVRYQEMSVKEFRKQEMVMETMKETYRKRLSESEEGRMAAAARANKSSNQQASAVFKQFDADGDGVMDEAEFAAAFATFNKPQVRPYPAPGSKEGRFDYQKRQFVAMYDCPADSQDELSLREGDLVSVIAEGEAGWFIARNAATGAEGLVPANYLAPVR